jgi:hypothetical protein
MKNYKKLIVKASEFSGMFKLAGTIAKADVPDNSLVVVMTSYEVYLFTKVSGKFNLIGKEPKGGYNINDIKEKIGEKLETELGKDYHVFVGSSVKGQLKQYEAVEPHDPLSLIPDKLNDTTSYYHKYKKDEDW